MQWMHNIVFISEKIYFIFRIEKDWIKTVVHQVARLEIYIVHYSQNIWHHSALGAKTSCHGLYTGVLKNIGFQSTKFYTNYIKRIMIWTLTFYANYS